MPAFKSVPMLSKHKSVRRFSRLSVGVLTALMISGGAAAQQGSFEDPFYGSGGQQAQQTYQPTASGQVNARADAQTGMSADMAARLQLMEDRLYRLERDVEGLVRLGGAGAGGRGQGGGLQGDAAASISLRLSALESEIAGVTGLIEEMRHQLMVARETNRKSREDFEYRLRALEARAGGGGGAVIGTGTGTGTGTGAGNAGQPAQPGGGPEQLPPDDLFGSPIPGGGRDMIADNGQPTGGAVPVLEPKPLYQKSMQQLAQRDYANAEASLTAFIERYPDHALTPNAQYWLGESHYARNDYKKAAAAFLAGVRNYPSSNKAPDSMLKLAMSLNQLGLNTQACGTLAELKVRHKNLSAKIAARVAREEQAMQCQ
ncbi:MAG: tol-pal system protein YbgF [Alphaproteobacteria bacterium]